MTNIPFFRSIRFKIVVGLVLLILPMISYLVYNNIYSIRLVRDQVAQSNSKLVNLYMGLIDKDLNEIDQYIIRLAARESGLLVLERPSEANSDDYMMSKYLLFLELSQSAVSFKLIDYLFVYSPVNQDLIFVPGNEGYDYDQNDFIKEDISEALSNDQKVNEIPYDKWLPYPINGEYYLVRVIKSGNAFVGAGIKANKVIQPLHTLDLETNGITLLADDKYRPMNLADFVESHQIDLNLEPDTYRLAGIGQKYLIIGAGSSKGDFSLIALVPDRNILAKLPDLQKVIWILACGSVLLLMSALFFFRKVVMLPVRRIVTAMRKIKLGYLETRISGMPSSIEFELMNDTFDSMVSQIQQLKIDIYEEQLSNQKAEFRQLQLQINPHFFLNSLNIVYYLAQEKNLASFKNFRCL